ncbi:2-hydroxyglutaryl-CoA dehydratase [Myxococcota bacterium]|nr:2-hydroxyglutaryl-CoA dehydratase [Myxococcota bacterium]
MNKIVSIGLDAGSTTLKIVALDSAGEIVTTLIEPTHPLIEEQSERLIIQIKDEFGCDEGVVVATGYGRKLVKRATKSLTEISCHARGVWHEMKQPGTLVDIGGQDSKVIRIGEGGKAVDFMMNDKCAAGTGRFLENTAGRLQVSLDDLGPRALGAEKEEKISSTCTVFAESEIISLLAHGVGVDSILKGLHRSLISRIVAMIHTVGLVPPLMLSGGVAQNAAVRAILSEATGVDVILPERPQLMGALGAALVGLDLKKK